MRTELAIPDQDELLLLSKARVASTCGAGLAIRLAAGLSQAEVASYLDISRSRLSRWENRLSAPRGAAGIEYGRFLERFAPTPERA